MVVMTPREKWTDERLDDLNKKVDDGFAQVDKRFEQVDKRFDRLEDRMDAHHRTLVAGLFVLGAAIIGSNTTLAAVAFF
jgi:tetrahydromethanopterin S-methyltransferase subunit G